MTQTDLAYYVALSQVPGIGTKRFKVLITHFKLAKEIWHCPEADLKKILEPAVFKSFTTFRTSVNPEKILESVSKKGIGVLTLRDKNYPKLLKQIFDPPPVL